MEPSVMEADGRLGARLGAAEPVKRSVRVPDAKYPLADDPLQELAEQHEFRPAGMRRHGRSGGKSNQRDGVWVPPKTSTGRIERSAPSMLLRGASERTAVDRKSVVMGTSGS